jgi:glyoxylase-like metal-dependent hydrolase (beta-lactamase superfamily II)
MTMRKLFTALIFLTIPVTQVFSDTTDTSATIKVHQAILNDYKPEKVSEHTYVIHGPMRSDLKKTQGFVNNPAFIISDKSVIVVDPGTSVQIGRALLQHIKKITKKPITHVFNTHIHGDHWLGNQAFSENNPDVKIFAHPAFLQAAKDGEAKQWLDIFLSASGGTIKGTEVVLPTIGLIDQKIIKIDNLSIKSHLSDWAHTKTDVMLEVVEDKLLFTGDTVNNKRIVPFEGGSFKGSIESISKAMKLGIKVVVPGHGATSNGDILATYKAGLESIYQTTKTLVEEGMEAYEMKDKALASNTAFKNWEGLEDEIGRYLSLAVEEIEQEDF